MGESSKIEWCDHTFNPWEGCQKVGPGCDHCYAETRNARFGGGTAPNWGPAAPRRRTSPANWRKPLAWNREAERTGKRPRVFCASLADVFDNAVPREWREDLFDLIGQTPNLDWLLLTKRVGNVGPMVYGSHSPAFLDGIPDNIILGATMVNQDEVDRDWAKLAGQPARRVFVSVEPMLGPIELPRLFLARKPWIICGGESGPGARPMHPDWARSLRDQCAAAGVPFLFKQWGEWVSHLDRDKDDSDWRAPYSRFERSPSFAFLNLAGGCGFHGERLHVMQRVGKHAAGRLLDGVQHDGFPASNEGGVR